MKKMLNVLSLILIVVGALNWGLWGFFQFDLVAWLAHGNTTTFARIIYGVVGLAGLWGLGCLGKFKALCGCHTCCASSCSPCSTSCQTACCDDKCKDDKNSTCCKDDKNNTKCCK